MAKTRGDLVNRALNILGAVGSGQTASPEDVALVDALVDPVLEELARRGVTYVGNGGVEGDMTTGDFSPSEFIPLAITLAKAAVSDFGGDIAGAYSMAVDAEARLRAMQNVGDDTDEPIRFMSY
jgi:hypothetical protein